MRSRHCCRLLIPAVLLLWPVWLAAQAAKLDAENEFNAGRSHLREGRPQDALEAFKRAIKLDSKNPYFYKGLGQAYLQLTKFDDAVSAFRKALEINRYYVDVRNDLGTALILAGRRDEGRQEYQIAYGDPTNPTPEITARNIGQSYFDEKRYSEALNWFRTAIDRNPHYPDAYVRLADTLAAMDQINEAIVVLEGATKTVPDDLGLTLAMGEAYYRAGRFTDARARLEQVVAKDPIGSSGRRASVLLKNFPK